MGGNRHRISTHHLSSGLELPVPPRAILMALLRHCRAFYVLLFDYLSFVRPGPVRLRYWVVVLLLWFLFGVAHVSPYQFGTAKCLRTAEEFSNFDALGII